MGLTMTELTMPFAVVLIAFLGYLVGHRRRRRQEATPPAPHTTTDETDSLIEKIEQLSNQLRRSMATHHSTVSRCREQIRVLSESHLPDSDSAPHMHLQAMLGPTDRLSHDIALAYDELRQHTRDLARLRTH
ncbi:MAG: hypothetical protein ACYC3X_28215 [Pirellulaceae bacterium]